MLDVILAYNPYRVSTELIVDGSQVPADITLMDMCRGRRLQDWIDRFFPALVDYYRTKRIRLAFRGNILDAEDVESAREHFLDGRPDVQIELHTETADCPVEDRVSRLRDLFRKAKDGPFDEFRTESLDRQFRQALEPSFEVNVVATMSSGKSTVVNAMLGTSLMPSKNEACTATIARIEDHDDMEGFRARRLDRDGEILDDWQDGVDQDLLSRWNEDADTSIIDVQGNIPAVDEKEDVRLVFVDTPGPNSSRDPEHRKRTVRAITQRPLSMVLYILNATQLSTDDDCHLLDLVSTAMEEGGRQAQDRFIFIANKIDSFDPEEGESVAKALASVRQYLVDNGITNPLVIPASAELAKLVRMCRLSGMEFLTKKQRGNLRNFLDLFTECPEMNMLEHVRDSIGRTPYRRLKKRLAEASGPHEKGEILSGIPIIEELLNDFLDRHAIPAKIKDAVDSFLHVMSKAEGIERLTAQLSSDRGKREALVTALEGFQENEKRIGMAKRFRERVAQMKYSPSRELKAKYKEVRKNAGRLLEDRGEDFEEDMDPRKATRIFERTTQAFQDYVGEIQEILSWALQVEFLTRLESLRSDYQKHVQDLLREGFPDTVDAELLQLQEGVLEMPPIQTMLANHTYEDEVEVDRREVSDSTWYNPFSWGSTRIEIDYETIKKVSMKEPWKVLGNSLRDAVQKTSKECDVADREKAEEAKQVLLRAMDGIDGLLLENVRLARDAQESQAKAEEMIRENEKKLAWYDGFRQELDGILAV